MKLRFIFQGQCIGECDLSDGEKTAGRDFDNTIVLSAYPSVSSKNTRFYQEGERVYIQDMGSKNGTWLNNKRVLQPMPLCDGDHIRFGDAELQVYYVKPEAALETDFEEQLEPSPREFPKKAAAAWWWIAIVMVLLLLTGGAIVVRSALLTSYLKRGIAAELSETPDGLSNSAAWYRRASEGGRHEAQYRLALCYKIGQGVESNATEALSWMHKAALGKHANAQYRMGLYYDKGLLGLDANDNHAVFWYMQAAQQKNPEACYELSYRYAEGRGVERNLEQSVRLLHEAARGGYPDALYDLGIRNKNARRYQEAIKWFEAAAEKQYAPAQYELGLFSLQGIVVLNPTAGVARVHQSAQQGYAPAQYELASIYAAGVHVQASSQEALVWLLRAAEQGLVQAQYDYGMRCLQSEGMGEEAAQWLGKAAANNHLNAQYEFALCLEQGRGVQENQAEALRLYRAAASRGHPDAQQRLIELISAQSPDASSSPENFSLFHQAALAGHAESQYRVGVLMLHGQHTRKNLEEATEWLKKAAAQGHANACLEIGKCYLDGIGVEKDVVAAVKWTKTAADIGLPEAQFMAAQLYEGRYGVPENMDMAFQYYNNAAEQGHGAALTNLLVCILAGKANNLDKSVKIHSLSLAAKSGMPLAQLHLAECYASEKDVVSQNEAMKWYVEAARQGITEALAPLVRAIREGGNLTCAPDLVMEWCDLAADKLNAETQDLIGQCYADGTGVKRNPDLAFKWKTRAANQGDVEAMHYVGVCYWTGNGVASNDIESVKWFRRAADGGHVDAGNNLGLALLEGRGVDRNVEEAASIFLSAAQQGHADAQFRLGVCYSQGIGVKQDSAQARFWMSKAAEQKHEEALVILQKPQDVLPQSLNIPTTVLPQVSRSVSGSQRYPDLRSSWENSLGMKFVPVVRTDVLFCIWETRVRDFSAFVKDFARNDDYDYRQGSIPHVMMPNGWQQSDLRYGWNNPFFVQGENNPVTCVSYKDAQRFCAWLTRKERAEGLIGSNQVYRLPQDWEWSIAVGLNEPQMGTPKEKHGKFLGLYPWGRRGSPPAKWGNYAGKEAKNSQWPAHYAIIAGYEDDHARTSPVGYYGARHGALCDLSGNVWEWCLDFFDGNSGSRVLRGGSWFVGSVDHLLSTFRFERHEDDRMSIAGFRVVLALEP